MSRIAGVIGPAIWDWARNQPALISKAKNHPQEKQDSKVRTNKRRVAFVSCAPKATALPGP